MKPKSNISTLMESGSLIGLFARASLFLLLMALTFGAAIGFAKITGVWFEHSVPGESVSGELVSAKTILAMFLVVVVPMLVGMFLFELPRGADWLMFRLGIATFCRTGLPLLIVLVVSVNLKVDLASAAYGFLAFFYLVGFLASVWISVNRFASSSSDSIDVDSVVEVDRAAV